MLAKRAAVVLLDPQAHTAMVEGVVALSPDHDTILASHRSFGVDFRLTLATQAGIHYLKSKSSSNAWQSVPAIIHHCSIDLL